MLSRSGRPIALSIAIIPTTMPRTGRTREGTCRTWTWQHRHEEPLVPLPDGWFRNAIRPSVLAHRCLSRIESDRPLRLVDLTADGLARIGADSRLTTGDYAVAQRWSLAFQNHQDEPDGIVYRARHDPSRLSAALFDRVTVVVRAERVGVLTDPSLAPLLAHLSDAYEFQLLDV